MRTPSMTWGMIRPPEHRNNPAMTSHRVRMEALISLTYLSLINVQVEEIHGLSQTGT